MTEHLHRERRARLLAALLIVALLPAGTSLVAPAAAAADPVLRVLEETLDLAADKAGTWAPVTLTLQNSGPELSNLSFVPVVTEDGKPLAFDIVLAPKPVSGLDCEIEPCIAGYSVARFTIEPTKETADQVTLGKKDLSGYLTVRTDANVVTDAVPLTLTPYREPRKAFGIWQPSIGSVIGIALIVAFLAFLLCLGWLFLKCPKELRKHLLGSELGTVTWKFSENWAATVTGISGIAGTIGGLALLQKETTFLLKAGNIDEFTALTAIFGLGVTLAPLVGTVLTTLAPKKGKPDVAQVWVYVVAVSLIVWAGFGQMLTGQIFLEEVGGSEKYLSMVRLLQVLLLILGLLVFVYAVVKTVNSVFSLVKKQRQPGTVWDLHRAVADAHVGAQPGGDLKDAVEKLKESIGSLLEWTLGPLVGTPYTGGAGQQANVPAIVRHALNELDKCVSTGNSSQASQLLAAMEAGLKKLQEALNDQDEKPEGVPDAVDALDALVQNPPSETKGAIPKGSSAVLAPQHPVRRQAVYLP